jgi:predicted DNA-binding WGR domain protein
MYKDAGAGIVKFFKVVAIRDNNNKSSLKIKSGKLSDVINSDRKKFDSFEDACEAAKELTRAKEKRGYKTK